MAKLRRLKRRSTVSRVVILPYKGGSASARGLAAGLTEKLLLKVRRVKPNGLYRPKSRSLLVNYGSSVAPSWASNFTRWLNSPETCQVAGNKLRAFQKFREAGLVIPEFTTDKQTAATWLVDGGMVVCRTILNGHSGRGIVMASNANELVTAPLYVRYKKKRKEFRVHVFQGAVIDVAEKRKRTTNANDSLFVGHVRSLHNGWVYCRDNIVRPTDLDGLAIAACRATGLDFGAVDILWNERENKCYLLEVNTAPGLQGTTLTNYVTAIYNWIRSQSLDIRSQG